MSRSVRLKKRLRPKARSAVEQEEIVKLEARIAEGAPASGGTQQNPNVPAEVNFADREKFADLPISQYTKDALREASFEVLTAVQRAAIPHALAGRDVLGAAKTGSGKTLAFLVPVLEKLYRLKWNPLDGLGALIIAPTRELAAQIFGELRKVVKYHDLSAGLLIGGKDVKEEKDRINRLNILVTTPGRLLQHMDETPGFDASQLQILVLDEADRCLDSGFAQTFNDILENLPRSRQVLLFSATQTKKVNDLKRRLHLDAPEYISVHAEATAPTPLKLQQFYMRCALPEKLDLLYSFIRSHLKAKTLVFLSTCKQVKFVYEAFCKLRPGVSLRHIHGKMKQFKRMGIFYDFNQAKEGMVLFATDLAARGLDFPAVDWVVQVDCPENVATYIHRVGRTARLYSGGNSVLMLLPSEEEGMLAALAQANVPIRVSKVNPKKTESVTAALQALLSKNKDLKELGQGAVKAYLRSVFLQPNKRVFDVAALPYREFALALGMPSIPELRFLTRAHKEKLSSGPRIPPPVPTGPDGAPAPSLGEEGAAPAQVIGGDPRAGVSAVTTGPSQGLSRPSAPRREARSAAGPPGGPGMRDRLPWAAGDAGEPLEEAAVSAEGGAGMVVDVDNDSENEDDFLVKKRRIDPEPASVSDREREDVAPQAKKRKRLKIRPGQGTGTRTVFGDDGMPADPLAVMLDDVDNWGPNMGPASKEQRFQEEAEALQQNTPADRLFKKAERARRKAEARARAKAAHEGGAVTLGTASNGLGGSRGDHFDEDGGGGNGGERSPSPPPIPRPVIDPACLGMQPGAGTARTGPADGEGLLAPRKQKQGRKVQNDGVDSNSGQRRGVRGDGGVLGLSLDEQEALVLRLLDRR
eukprot:jgi/Botrbrau1/16635/Bobra.0068s0054.1